MSGVFGKVSHSKVSVRVAKAARMQVVGIAVRRSGVVHGINRLPITRNNQWCQCGTMKSDISKTCDGASGFLRVYGAKNPEFRFLHMLTVMHAARVMHQ